MQKIIVEKPYHFIPPYRTTFWSGVFPRAAHPPVLPLASPKGSAGYEVRNIERLRASIDAGHGVLDHAQPSADRRSAGDGLADRRGQHARLFDGELAPVPPALAHCLGHPGDGGLQRQPRRGRSAGDQHGDRPAGRGQAAADHLSRRGHQPHGRSPAGAARRRGVHRPRGGQEAGQANAAGQGRRASGRASSTTSAATSAGPPTTC